MIFFKGILSKLRGKTTESKTTEIMEPSEYEAKQAAYRACFVEDNGSWKIGTHILDRKFASCEADRAAVILADKAYRLYIQSGFLILHDDMSGEAVFLNREIPREHSEMTLLSFGNQLAREFRKQLYGVQ